MSIDDPTVIPTLLTDAAVAFCKALSDTKDATLEDTHLLRSLSSVAPSHELVGVKRLEVQRWHRGKGREVTRMNIFLTASESKQLEAISSRQGLSSSEVFVNLLLCRALKAHTVL